MKKVTLIILLIGFMSLIYSQDLSSKTDSTNNDLPSSGIELPQNNPKSVIGYEQLYQNQKEINEKLLSLLTTSLSLIVGIIVAIIGTSIFYNYRFNKKEYELLIKENRSSLVEIHTSLNEETASSIEKILDQLKEEIDKKFEQINEAYRSNYDTTKDSLKTIIQHFKDDYDKRISDLRLKVEMLEKENNEIRESLRSDLRLNEKQIRKDLLDITGELYKMKGWYSLALGTFIDQAILCIEVGSNWQLEYVLPDIIESIEKVVSTNDTITPQRKSSIEELISKIPDHFKSERDKINDLYTKIGIKDIYIQNRYSGIGSLLSMYRSKK